MRAHGQRRETGRRRVLEAHGRRAAGDVPHGCDKAEGKEGDKVVLEGRGLTRNAGGCSAAQEEVGGGRNLVRKTAASGGPTSHGEHDWLHSGPPRERASGKEEEDVAEHLVVASVWHGMVGGEREVRRPADGEDEDGEWRRSRASRDDSVGVEVVEVMAELLAASV